MRHPILAAALFSVAALGCGGDGKLSLPSAVPAGGKVTTAGGQPVRDVRLLFVPVEARVPASGVAQADGSFTLQTYDNNAGACPGKYRVVFQANMGTKDEFTRSTAALQSIPLKYKEDNSPLEVEIPSGGNTSLDLRLDAK